MRRVSRIVFRVLAVLFAVHVLVLAALFFLQEKLVFHPPPKLASGYRFAYTAAFEEIYIPVSGNVQLHGLLFKAKAPSKGLVFYLHGNGGSLEGWGYMSEVYTSLGYDIFILDYRGYGKSGGEISNKDEMLEDVKTAYEAIKKRYAQDRIVVAGFSIGSGLAAYVASEEHPRMLLLQAPYYDLASVASARFPMVPMFLFRYNFTTSRYLDSVSCPVYMFHGTADHVVAYENSLRLKAEHPRIEFHTIEGLGHIRFNDDKEFQRELRRILD